jgi:hypothetical protein
VRTGTRQRVFPSPSARRGEAAAAGAGQVPQEISHADIVRHTDLTNRASFGLVQTGLDAAIHSGLVANVFLYYWLRASTSNANVLEPFFQTLERPWEIVVEREAAFVERLVQRTRP